MVETIAEAKRVFKILMDNVGDADRPVYHAVDTEVSHIDVSDQCPVGHGREDAGLVELENEGTTRRIWHRCIAPSRMRVLA